MSTRPKSMVLGKHTREASAAEDEASASKRPASYDGRNLARAEAETQAIMSGATAEASAAEGAEASSKAPLETVAEGDAASPAKKKEGKAAAGNGAADSSVAAPAKEDVQPSAEEEAKAAAAADAESQRRMEEQLRFYQQREAAAQAVQGKVKILLTPNVAGCVIGQRGSVINHIQSCSGSRIKLSQTHEFFPGTGERVGLVEGYSAQLVAALRMIFAQCFENPELKGGVAVGVSGQTTVKMLVPESVCSALQDAGPKIGQRCGVGLAVADPTAFGVHERILQLSGTLEPIVQAAGEVLSLMRMHGGVYTNPSTHYSNNSGGGGGGGGGYGQMGGMAAGMQAFHRQGTAGPPQTVQLAVHDSQVGLLVGRGGEVITNLQVQTQTRIKISQKGEYIPGTQNRTVTITGSSQGVQAAQLMVAQLLQQDTYSKQASGQLGATAGYGAAAGTTAEATAAYGAYQQQQAQQQQQQQYAAAYGQQQAMQQPVYGYQQPPPPPR